jgi:predicted HTH domain antitoxin
MRNVTIPVPDGAFVALGMEPEALAAELRLAAAAKMYEMGRLSSGAAAELAGVPRAVFLSKLADYGVATFRLSEEEVRADAERA